MPVGLVVMKWDDRIGTEILAKYPEEIVITDKTLMQVYSTHEYSGESGMISLMVGSLNIASYYTGPDKGYYILLLLNLDDDPDTYEGGLINASRNILENLDYLHKPKNLSEWACLTPPSESCTLCFINKRLVH